MESIKVDTDQVRTAADVVDDYARNYENHYNELLKNVQDFTTTDWTGADADEFRNKVEDFRDDFVRMKELMNEYAKTLRDFAGSYDDEQTMIRQQAQGLRS